MIASILLLSPLLATQALAEQGFSHLTDFGGLSKRQSEAFVPGTTPGCPSDWPICGTSGICYNPDQGQTCCPGGKYACPSNSFCLQEPYCCPDGLDPETCAKEYGITLLPSTSATETPTPSPEPTPSEPLTSETPDVPETTPEPTPTGSPSASETVTPTPSTPVIPSVTPSTTPSSSTVVTPTGGVSDVEEPTASTANPENPLFTGGAGSREMAGAAAVVLGGLGLLGNLI